RFDRAWSGGDHYFRSADFHASAKIDDRALRLESAAGELEGLRDADHFADAGEQFEIAVIEIAMNADGPENGVRGACGAVDGQAAGDDAVDALLDLLFAGAFLHYDDHGWFLIYYKFGLRDKRTALEGGPYIGRAKARRLHKICWAA